MGTIISITFALWIIFALRRDFYKINVLRKMSGAKPLTIFGLLGRFRGISSYFDFSKYEPMDSNITQYSADFRKINNSVVVMRVAALLTIFILLFGLVWSTFFSR